MTRPFRYPPARRTRRHGPRGYADYGSYRPWLRDEFSYRCAYCLLREQWGRVRALFDLDHFVPVAAVPDRIADYENLVYACTTCNATKGEREVPDPLSILSEGAVQVAEDGTILATSPEASRLVELLGLDGHDAVEFRLLWIGIVALAARHDQGLYERLMGYPDDLPDLSRLAPPGGNERPDGLGSTAFALRQRGELPSVFE